MLPRHHNIDLVGNVVDMSPRVVATPTMLAENGRRHNVADAVIGFVAGSRVGLDIYLVFFYLDIYMVIFPCSTTAKMFPSLPPSERVVPIDGIIHTSQGYPHDVHHFGCRTALLSVRTAHGFGGLLRRPGKGTGQTHDCFVFAVASDNL